MPNTNTTMTHRSAKETFDALDQAAKNLLMELAQEDAENIEWSEDHQPKYHPWKGGRCAHVAYDKKTNQYTTIDNNTPG